MACADAHHKHGANCQPQHHFASLPLPGHRQQNSLHFPFPELDGVDGALNDELIDEQNGIPASRSYSNCCSPPARFRNLPGC